jgi:hypothetical protein
MKVPATVDTVKGLLSGVDSIQAVEFPDDQPTSLAKYGLSQPKVYFEVWESDKKEPKVLMIGSERKSDHKMYIKNRSVPYVFLVNPEVVKSLETKKPGDFRPKDFMQFTNDSATGLVLRKGGKVFTYTKNANGTWYSKERPSANSEAPGVLAPLATTLILDYADRGVATGLENPAVTAEVTLSDGKKHVYKYGKRIGEDRVYLASDQGSDALIVASYIMAHMESIFSAPIQPAVTTKK